MMGCQDKKPPYQHRIVCTGKRTHREVDFRKTFAKAFQVQSELLDGIDAWELYGHWRDTRRAIGPPLDEEYRFTCKYCGRDTQLSAATLVKTLDAYNDLAALNDPDTYASRRHIAELDISRLPF